MITRASFEHTGTCEPCSQQQMIVRQRSGQYVAKLSIDTIYTLCSMYTQFGILKSNIVKPYLQTAFPKNKNVTKHNIWSLKRKIKEISKERWRNQTQKKKKRKFLHLHLQSIETSTPRHWYVQKRYVHHEQFHQRHLRESFNRSR